MAGGMRNRDQKRQQAQAQEVQPRELSILQKWAGDYPISAAPLFPKGQRSSAAGYIGDGELFSAVKNRSGTN